MAKRNVRTRAFAKTLRAQMTPPEIALWAKLRAGRLHGIKFVKQHPIGPYVADFAARDLGLVIELDGDSHAGREAHDAGRTMFMEGHGYKVIRFPNREVMTNMEDVLRSILIALGRDWT